MGRSLAVSLDILNRSSKKKTVLLACKKELTGRGSIQTAVNSLNLTEFFYVIIFFVGHKFVHVRRHLFC